MVFSKQNECDRTDIHLCHMPHADKTYCLQSTLKLPKVPPYLAPYLIPI